MTKELSRLRQFIIDHYNLEELRTLCFDLGVEYDDLRGEGRGAKARELVGWLARRDRLDQLLTALRQTRPDPFHAAGLGTTPIPQTTVTEYLAADLVKSRKFPLNEPYYAMPERETEIDAILETLRRPQGRPLVLVSGIGGIGKTALAVEVARRCARDPDVPFQAITWESAKQELLLDDEIVQVHDAVIAAPELIDSLGRQLAGPDFIHKSARKKEETLRDLLYAAPCLVIVDNLETLDNAREVLLRLQELIGPSRALITSRETVAGDLFKVPLQGLPEASSITFLRREGQERNVQEVAQAGENTLREIHQVTQGMPLAMKLVVGQAEVLGLDVALDNLRRGRGDIYFFIFLESWRQLSDPAKKLLLYLGPTVSAVGREELEEVLEMEGAPMDQAIQELVRLSMINAQPMLGLKQRGYSIHQLTRYFVVNDLPAYWMEQGLL